MRKFNSRTRQPYFPIIIANKILGFSKQVLTNLVFSNNPIFFSKEIFRHTILSVILRRLKGGLQHL